MSAPEVNIPLLRKAVEWAEAEAAKPKSQSLWHQGAWSETAGCGTAYCIAGYVAQVVDARYEQSQNVEGVHVSNFAAEALGIGGQVDSCGQENCTCTVDLFSASNTIADVRRIAEDIAGERL